MDSSIINAENSSTTRTGYGSTTCNIFVDGNINSILETTKTTTTTTTTTKNITETSTTLMKTSTVGYQTLSSNSQSLSSSLSISSTSTLTSTPSSNSCDSLYNTTEIHKISKEPSFEISSRLLTMQVDIKSHALDKENKQILPRVEFLLNLVNHILIGFITIYMTWLCFQWHLQKTALHAWLVTLGFNFLMAEALMCYYNHNILTANFHRNTKTLLHWILQLLGGSLGIAGVLIKCIQKSFFLQTVHGISGFIAFILCCLSLCSGLTALYSVKLKQRLSPLLNKTFHNLFGLMTFLLALIAQYYGYETGLFTKDSINIRYLLQYLTILIFILTCIGPLKALYHKCNSLIKTYF